MSGAVKARSGRIFPARRAAALPWVALFVVLAAAGAFVAVFAGGDDGLSGALAARTGGRLAVSVWGQGLESGDAATARAQEILAGRGDLGPVEWLSGDPRDRTLAVLAGAPADRLDEANTLAMAVRGPAAAATVKALLAANGLAGAVDTHDLSSAPVQALARGLAIGGGLAVLTLIAFMFAVRAATRRELKVNAQAVALMLEGGGEAAFVAGLAWRKWAAIAVFSGLLGAVTAAVAAAVWARYWPHSGLGLSPGGPTLAGLFWTGPYAVAAAVLGLAGAWVGAQLQVRRLT